MERGINLPLTQVEFGILCGMAVLYGLILWWVWASKIQDSQTGRQRSDSERLIEIFAWLLSPVWLALLLFVVYAMWRIGNRLVAEGPGTDLRWYALGFVGLITSLVALVSAPLALIRVSTTERQTRTAEQGHMTDRISKAVEQLGAEKTVKKIVGDKTQEISEPNLEVRIGGLLSLERIAQDSTAYDKGRDHVRVMEIICAYIRTNATPKDAVDDMRRQHARAPLRADVFWALTILERRSDLQKQIEAAHGRDDVQRADWIFADDFVAVPIASNAEAISDEMRDCFFAGIEKWKHNRDRYSGYRLDLRETRLQGAVLAGFRLRGFRLNGARLEGADLTGADLAGADLTGAVLERAQLEGADFRCARMEQANLTGANMNRTDLTGADLCAQIGGAYLCRARLVGAQLQRADLMNSNLADAELMLSDLSHADLTGAHLERANLAAAQLKGANLMIANLIEANLNGTCLPNAILYNAAVKGTNFALSVGVTAAQIGECYGDASVVLPPSLQPPPEHWPKSNLEYGTFRTKWQPMRVVPNSYSQPQ